MTLNRLLLQHFRNLSTFDITLDPSFHVISGKNGSGKTSILEAIYHAAYHKSFRTSNNKLLIQNHGGGFHLHADILTHDQTPCIYKYHYQANGQKSVLINEEKSKTTETARLLPCVHMDTNTHRLLAGQPKWRRDFLNFCAFYTLPDYAENMARYNKVLAQRNKLLKHMKQLDTTQLGVWDQPLVFYGQRIFQARSELIATLSEKVPLYAKDLLEHACNMRLNYHKALGKHHDFMDALHATRMQDLAMGYTHVGPHRDDFSVMTPTGHCVFDVFSQGQLKRLAYCLKLTQLYLVLQHSQQKPLLLLDDISAELDQHGQHGVLERMRETQAQCVITSIDDNWPTRTAHMAL